MPHLSVVRNDNRVPEIVVDDVALIIDHLLQRVGQNNGIGRSHNLLIKLLLEGISGFDKMIRSKVKERILPVRVTAEQMQAIDLQNTIEVIADKQIVSAVARVTIGVEKVSIVPIGAFGGSQPKETARIRNDAADIVVRQPVTRVE